MWGKPSTCSKIRVAGSLIVLTLQECKPLGLRLLYYCLFILQAVGDSSDSFFYAERVKEIPG